MNAQIHTDFLIRVVDDDGKVLAETFGYGSVYSYNEFLKLNYPLTEEVLGDGKIKVFTVPKVWDTALGVLRPGKKNPLKCNYHAVRNYLGSLFGVVLSTDDEEFFENHPCVQQDGVPMQDTLRVIQELVDPYGFRISRVQMAPGVSVAGDLIQWRRILGVNPAALADKGTTNADWRRQVPEDVAEYNFEYSEIPLRPSITCAVMADPKGQNVTTGLSHGHASYTAPRGKITKDSVMLSVQLQRKEMVKWNAEPKYAEVGAGVEQEPIVVIDLGKCWQLRNAGTGTKVYSVDKRGDSALDNYCYVCRGYDFKTPSVVAGNPPGVCIRCWEEQTGGAFCTDKNCLGAHDPSWSYDSHDAKGITVICDYCKRHYSIASNSATFSKAVNKLLDAINKMISFNLGRGEARKRRETPPVTKDGKLTDVPLPTPPPIKSTSPQFDWTEVD
jgi:hypothetical protein